MTDAKVPLPSRDPRRFTSGNGEADDLERRFEDLFERFQALEARRRDEMEGWAFRVKDVEERLWKVEQRLTSIEQS